MNSLWIPWDASVARICPSSSNTNPCSILGAPVLVICVRGLFARTVLFVTPLSSSTKNLITQGGMPPPVNELFHAHPVTRTDVCFTNVAGNGPMLLFNALRWGGVGGVGVGGGALVRSGSTYPVFLAKSHRSSLSVFNTSLEKGQAQGP